MVDFTDVFIDDDGKYGGGIRIYCRKDQCKQKHFGLGEELNEVGIPLLQTLQDYIAIAIDHFGLSHPDELIKEYGIKKHRE